jgi:hypothetical protein
MRRLALGAAIAASPGALFVLFVAWYDQRRRARRAPRKPVTDT